MALSYQQWLEQEYMPGVRERQDPFSQAAAQAAYGQYVNAQQGAAPMWLLEDIGGAQQLRDVATGLPTQFMGTPNDPGDYARYEAFQQQARDVGAYSGADYGNPNSAFWQNRYSADTPWQRVVSENQNLHTLENLYKAGYFDRFTNFDAAGQQQLGELVASMQNTAADSRHHADRSMLAMAAAIGGGILGSAYSGAGQASNAASGGTGTASSAGVSAGAGGELTGGLTGTATSGGAAAPAGITYGTAAGDVATIYGTGAATGGGSAGLLGGTGAGAVGLDAGASSTSGVTGGGAAGGALTGGAASTGAGLLSNPQLLGAGAGALLGGMGGSSKAGTTTTEEGIPDWLMPYVKPALDKYSTDLQNYQTDPYGIMPSAMNQFKNTVGGMYLDPSTNKYLEDYFRLGAERIKGSLSPSFGHMQAFGQHSGYNEALSRGLGDYAVGLYGGAYEKERDRQTQLTAAAPAFLGQSSQAQVNPYTQYLQSVGGLGKKKEEPYFNNQFGNILGGAMFGSQFGKAFT